ncbi:MAG: hypothetical protein AVDCRST_MAG88-1172 [uncultured Thermomicrobiales bacterium]|uniref:Uncharacterized protein n=1 Tax=uncultured Thermomicrobiales bacterium TaxID=1645740 RepID=A0A6J4UQB1_9BACT|nr:MAG: hypothetical protein AVDCRST_MAG88-1172 [uncultured Thermomicrobiales bacterium]
MELLGTEAAPIIRRGKKEGGKKEGHH